MVEPRPIFSTSNQRRAVALAALSGMTYLVNNLFPFINGGLAQDLHFGPRELGYISSAFILASGAIVATAPWWIRRVGWRMLTAVACLMVALALLFALSAREFVPVLAALTACGAAAGLMQSTTFTSLGDMPDPHRAYGWSLAAQMAIQSIVALIAASLLMPRWGLQGLLGSVALLFVISVPLCLALPATPTAGSGVHGEAEAEEIALSPATLVAPLAGLVATATFIAGIFAIWYFLEQIANAKGIPLGTVGLAVAISGVVTVATATAVAILGSRVLALAGVAAGVVLATIGISALAFDGPAMFVLGVCGLSCGWGVGQPYLWGMTSMIDQTRRLFSASPAALGLGGAFGTAIGGQCVDRWGLTSLLYFAGACIWVGLATAAVALWLAHGPIARRAAAS